MSSNWIKISSGSYGTVYRVTDKDKDYAYKVSDFTKYSSSILRELQILSRVRHPNIISLVEFYPQRNFILVLELAMGNLIEYHMDIPKIKFLGYQLVRGLAYMHSQDIIHRDIKPGNILYTECDKTTKVMYADFGLSTYGNCPQDNKFKDLAFTTWYRPPEVLLNDTHSLASDVWALGCCLGEFYEGKPIFPGQDESDQLKRIFTQLGVPQEESWPGVTHLPAWRDYSWGESLSPPQPFGENFSPPDPDLIDLLKQMLVLNPQKRSTASQLIYHPFFDSVRDIVEERLPCLYHEDNTYQSCRDLIKNRAIIAPPISISQRHRDILFSWLLGVNIEMELDIACLPLAYKIFDLVVGRQKLSLHQKIASSSLFIAGELIDPYNNHIDEYVEFGDGAFSLPRLYSQIFGDVKKVGTLLYQSTPYHVLFLLTKDFIPDIKKLSILFLILIMIDKKASFQENEIIAFAAIFLALLYYPEEIFVYEENFSQVQELALTVYWRIEGREANLLIEEISKGLTGLSWREIKLKIENNINSWPP